MILTFALVPLRWVSVLRNIQLRINNIELETSVKVYDLLGHLVAKKKASNGSLCIPLEGVGVYTVLMQQVAGKQQVRRVICK